MIHPTHRRILLEMLSLPTAPFAEGAVVAYLERFCRGRDGLAVSRDGAGNVLVHLRRRRSGAGRHRLARPVCLTAHLDHPGFVAERMTGENRLRAVWRGGVRAEYFVGARVRFHAQGRWIRGKVRSITQCREGKVKRVNGAVIEVARPVPPGAPGMWDFPDASIRGNRVRARGCDDMAGAAAMVCCIEEVVRRRLGAEAYFLFTRAEEVGFAGALAASRLKTIPARCCVVAVENSSELPSARIGDGPILRVGDKASVFHPAATAHCAAAAADLAARDAEFVYQRKLMDGGTCESSAYCQFGYEATGLCLALGNYHNMDLRRKRLAPEYIDLRDFGNLVKWFVELARSQRRYADSEADLRQRLAKLDAKYRRLLRQTRDTRLP
ncbi:MAG: M20/M25/M40 family metallo-hydrolase [Planctomycetota bacterium]|jgi:endoglucanase